jgi:hypothetical protein
LWLCHLNPKYGGAVICHSEGGAAPKPLLAQFSGAD